MVEPLELRELEPLSGTVCTGLIGIGASSLDARVGIAVTGETHYLALSLLDCCGIRVLCVGVLSGMLMAPVYLDGQLLREAR